MVRSAGQDHGDGMLYELAVYIWDSVPWVWVFGIIGSVWLGAILVGYFDTEEMRKEREDRRDGTKAP